LGERLRREEGGWRLSLPGGRELGLLERSRLTLARGLSGTVFLACVEAGGTGQRGWGVLESFEPGAV
ncbi:MAG: hypothetical protein M3498_06980, partial [Deinococcota bacterium]|nr:hypothetical protein [Deinococcota bacterium]